MAPRQPDLTTTSYAVLGFLAIRPFTTYELATQMDRTLNHVWPRARSKLYEEPKKLVAHGLATATRDRVGKRPRTVYSITPVGRRALKAWLKKPPDAFALESEPLVKLFFADYGTKDDALASVAAARLWAQAQLDVFADVTRAYLAGEGPFPERFGVAMIGARFMVDFYRTVIDWSWWASESITKWPDDPRDVSPDWTAASETLERAVSPPDDSPRQGA